MHLHNCTGRVPVYDNLHHAHGSVAQFNKILSRAGLVGCRHTTRTPLVGCRHITRTPLLTSVTHPHSQMVLALHLRRDYWDSILSQSIMSNYNAHLMLTPTPEAASAGGQDAGGERKWKSSLRASNVVVQWDPDHAPFTGHRQNYR